MIKQAISKLLEGQTISRDEAYQVMTAIMSGETTDAQIAAYLVALRMAGETPEVIAGSVQAMREVCTRVDAGDPNVVDIVGTGGDGAHTFNISTAGAIVAAGAGVTVAKHGNRSVSSKCGAADVLENLGVNLGAGPDVMAACLKEIGLAFLFAPGLHPAMKHAIGPRKELAVRTIFNILGPLTNPAGALRGVMGVYAADLVDTIAAAVTDLDAQHFYIVHGGDGLDEITTTTKTEVAKVTPAGVERFQLDPADLGMPYAKADDLKGGDPAENAQILRAILDGAKGPKRDTVLLTAAAGIVAGGRAADFAEGLQKAAESIDSSAAKGKLNALVERTNA